MAIRRGMSDYRQAGAGGIIFMGLLQALTFPMSYEQRKILYRGLYSAIVAKIEVDKRIKVDTELDARIGILISGVKLLIDQAGTDYKSFFESEDSYGELENNYAELQAQILDKHWEIAVKANLIETVTDDGVHAA